MSSPKEIIDGFVNSIKDWDSTPATLNLMREGTSTVLRRIKSNLDVSVQEKSEPIVSSFVSEISGSLGTMVNSWIDNNSNQLMVVPEGTRFVHRDSTYLTIIVEQKPTVRRIAFMQAYYNISLPYIQFYVTFHCNAAGDNFNSLHITATKRPITSLQDQYCLVPLPNVSSTSVCVGNMNLPNNGGRNITEKVNTIISSYWSSEFNIDLNQNLQSFLNDVFFYDFARKETDRHYENYVRGFEAWQKLTSEDSMFAIKPQTILQTSPRYLVGNLLPSDLASRNSKVAFVNNMKSTINEGVAGFVRSLTTHLNSVDIMEENRNQPHMVALQSTVRNIASTAYSNMWSELHHEHEKKVAIDNANLDRKKNEIESIVANSASILRNIELERERIASEKLKVQCELYAVNQYLLQKLEEVSVLKAKLSQHIDENGDIVVTKKRGRPKKENLPDSISISLNRVASSPLVIGPDGQPIKRGRGRPRKAV
jgi:hypothetical protein